MTETIELPLRGMTIEQMHARLRSRFVRQNEHYWLGSQFHAKRRNDVAELTFHSAASAMATKLLWDADE